MEFEVSKTTFTPFEEIEVEWRIRSKRDDIQFEDYIFSLVATEGIIEEELDSRDKIFFNPHKNTLLRIRGRKRLQGRGTTTLGSGIALTVDESDCSVREISGSLFDFQVREQLSDFTSSTSSIRLRDDVVAIWHSGYIEYKLPLELVLNNFFNGDLDIKVEIRFKVHHEGEQTDLEVNITHNSNANFHFLEDILSGGSSAIIAKTVNKMLPLVLNCELAKVEELIVRQLINFLGSLLDTHRLLAVRVVPLGNLNHLSLVLCPLPQESGFDTAPRNGEIAIE